MSSHGVGRLHIVSGTVKAMDYIEILQNKLLPTTFWRISHGFFRTITPLAIVQRAWAAWGYSNILRTASSLVWLVEGDDMWEASDHHSKGFSPKIEVESIEIVLSPAWYSKLRSYSPGIALHTTVAGKWASSPEDEQEKQGESRDSDEEHFWLNGYVNKQNCRIWSEANPQVYVATLLHPEKLTVW
ncbi:hypothetical protein TNCV_367521 [Trichonephila clavipes]|nr:hypothetical protein TNCV_367521 [Trichonephila clavipes]